MAGRGKLGQAELGLGEDLLCIVESLLLEQGATENDLRVADLVEKVGSSLEELERMSRLLLGETPITGAEMNLCERRNSLRRVGVAADLERDGKRALEIGDRL